jgi:small subunit ribosomal protein S2
MDELPGAIFVVDPKREKIAVKEGRKLGIPVIAIADSNCDPDEIDFILPGNDDAIRAIRLFCSKVADACIEGHDLAEERLRAEAELLKEQEMTEEEVIVSDESEEGGPEVIILPKKEEAETGVEVKSQETDVETDA